MALPPELEARIQECEKRAKKVFDEARTLEQQLDDLTSQIDSGEIDAATAWEDPSVVRHVEDLKRTAERVKRESVPPIKRRAGSMR